ncbi:MAG: hypothetical protein V1919_02710 [Candidatus Omnitrophota bacterium]
MSYSRKSSTKPGLFFIGIVLLVIFIILISCNLALNFQKNKISALANEFFAQKLTIGNLLYLPPGYVFAKDVVFIDKTNFSGKKIIAFPLLKFYFSPSQLLKTGKLVITDICVYNPYSVYQDLRDFVKNNSKQIWRFLLVLPRQDVKFRIKGAHVDFGSENGGPSYVNSHFFLKIKDGAFFGYGSFSRNLLNRSAEIPFEYSFKGSLEANGITVNDLEVMRDNVYVKLWGSVRDLVLRVNGFAFLNTVFKEYAYFEPFQTPKERYDNFLRGFSSPPKPVEMPKVDLFILDLDSQINFSFPEIDIQRLKFSLNNNPMSLSGKINFSPDKPVFLDLLYSANFSQIKGWPIQGPASKKISVSLKGSFQDKVFTGNSNIKFGFLKKNAGNLPLEEFNAEMENMFFSFKQYPKVTVSAKNAGFFCRTNSRNYRAQLQYLGLAANINGTRAVSAQFDSRFYDGRLKGRVEADLSQPIPGVTSYLRVKNVTANKLENLLEHFSKVHGKLSGQMRFKSFPAPNLKGGLIVNQGYIENFEFLKWLAGFFDLPSLKKIEFPRATLNFSAGPEGAGLSNINLISSDLALTGAFHLGVSDMVTSKLSLTCTRPLLEQTEKFKPLLRLAGQDVSSLTFDFRLSGSLHQMNFLWLESDFKRKLRDAIPGFMERNVERKIEESLSPAPK